MSSIDPTEFTELPRSESSTPRVEHGRYGGSTVEDQTSWTRPWWAGSTEARVSSSPMTSLRVDQFESGSYGLGSNPARPIGSKRSLPTAGGRGRQTGRWISPGGEVARGGQTNPRGPRELALRPHFDFKPVRPREVKSGGIPCRPPPVVSGPPAGEATAIRVRGRQQGGEVAPTDTKATRLDAGGLRAAPSAVDFAPA